MNRRQVVRALLAMPALAVPVLSTLSSALARQSGQKRVALVIGNRTYKNAKTLKNPVNDATDVADTLRDCGFTVILRTDRTDDEMSADIKAFKAQLTTSTVALFYFSGHGMQIDSKNYLLPVDFASDDPDEMKKHSVEADAVLEKMTCAFRIMILDACRNTPFTRAKGDTGKGLNFMTIPEDYDTLIAYATAPGSIADDNPKERNGIYTKHLLSEIRKPGASLSDLFSNISRAVKTETKQRQRPRTDYETLPAFYFVPPPIPQPNPPASDFNPTRAVELFTLKGHSESVNSVAFAPDGKRLITASRLTARVWDATTGKQLVTLEGHSGTVESTSFSPDSKRILTASNDETVKVWDAATGKELFTLTGHISHARPASFSPDGKRIVTTSNDETAKVWDAATGKELFTLEGHSSFTQLASFSPDSKRILTASLDNTAKVWDAATGKELFTLEGHRFWVELASFSPDGRRILTRSNDNTAKVWDANTGQEILTLKAHSGIIWSIAFSPDSKRILTGSNDNTAKVWELRE